MRDQLRSQKKIYLALAAVIVVVLLDRFTKAFFLNTLSLGESIPVVRNIFHFTLVHNTGIAFGLFKNSGLILVIFPIVAIISIGCYFYYNRHDKNLSRVYIAAFSLIVAGAIGNLIDRIFIGYVVDFIDFRIWPVFNVADSAITIGIAVILLKSFQSLPSSIFRKHSRPIVRKR